MLLALEEVPVGTEEILEKIHPVTGHDALHFNARTRRSRLRNGITLLWKPATK
jgi:hypothetical protein